MRRKQKIKRKGESKRDDAIKKPYSGVNKKECKKEKIEMLFCFKYKVNFRVPHQTTNISKNEQQQQRSRDQVRDVHPVRAEEVQDERGDEEAIGGRQGRAHLRQGAHGARDLLGLQAAELGLHPRGPSVWLRGQDEEERDGAHQLQQHQREGERAL